MSSFSVLGNIGSFLAGLSAIWVVASSHKPALGLAERPHVYRRADGWLAFFLPMKNYGNATAKKVLLKSTLIFGDQKESVEYRVDAPWFPGVPMNWDLAGVAIPPLKPFDVILEIQWQKNLFWLGRVSTKAFLRWNGDLSDLNLYLKNKAPEQNE
jgi:hypothetical protein